MGAAGRTEGEEKYIRGFVHLRCTVCGEEFGIYLREWQNNCICHACRAVIPFEGMHKAEATCERCGWSGRWMTNCPEDRVKIRCLECGDVMQVNRRRERRTSGRKAGKKDGKITKS